MVDESRISLYDYLYNIFYDVVTKNVYSMNPPQELTSSDTKDGFIVIKVGSINDESEFDGETYGWARCYVMAFIPTISRGRLDYVKYKEYEDGINSAIKSATEDSDGTYHIQNGNVLSTDNIEMNNANNVYFTFIKSFVVNIDKKE